MEENREGLDRKIKEQERIVRMLTMMLARRSLTPMEAARIREP